MGPGLMSLLGGGAGGSIFCRVKAGAGGGICTAEGTGSKGRAPICSCMLPPSDCALITATKT